MTNDKEKIEILKREFLKEVQKRKLENIVGAGISEKNGEYSIRVYIREKQENLPEHYKGVPLSYVLTGEFEAR